MRHDSIRSAMHHCIVVGSNRMVDNRLKCVRYHSHFTPRQKLVHSEDLIKAPGSFSFATALTVIFPTFAVSWFLVGQSSLQLCLVLVSRGLSKSLLLSSAFAAFSFFTHYMNYPVFDVFRVQAFPIFCPEVDGNLFDWFHRISDCLLLEWPYDIFGPSTLAYTASNVVEWVIDFLSAVLLCNLCLSTVFIVFLFISVVSSFLPSALSVIL